MSAHLGSGHGYVEKLPSAPLWNGSGEEQPETVSGEQRGFVLQRDSRLSVSEHSSNTLYTHIPHAVRVRALRRRVMRDSPVCEASCHFHLHVSENTPEDYGFVSHCVTKSFIYNHSTCLIFSFINWHAFGCNNRRCHTNTLFRKMKGHYVMHIHPSTCVIL